MPPDIQIAAMVIEDHGEVHALWSSTEGIGLMPDDEPEPLRRLLLRNPGLSLVARRQGRLVGAVLCSHDGRRGMINHLAVASDCRNQGIGSTLLDRCLASLEAEHISRCNLLVYASNEAARRLYARLHWRERTDLMLVQRQLPRSGG